MSVWILVCVCGDEQLSRTSILAVIDIIPWRKGKEEAGKIHTASP
jgi:hypothetical protein